MSTHRIEETTVVPFPYDAASSLRNHLVTTGFWETPIGARQAIDALRTLADEIERALDGGVQ